MYYISRIFGVLSLVTLGAAVWFSIVLARADFYFRKATPAAVERATEIAPRHTEYLALRALQVEYEGGNATALTEKIAALNPYSSAPRIRLGLAEEVAGDATGAERWLLDAARVDHQFEPRWTLANFYFRQGKADQFWTWMRAALQVSYGDRTPAFDLCWRVDESETLTRAIPDRHEVAANYLNYLLKKKADQSIVETAARVASYGDSGDLGLLLAACDRLIELRDAGALAVWRMTGHAAPYGIFNEDLASAPLNHGFDWRTMESAGVTQLGNRIALNGRQAEAVALLEQDLNVSKGRRYRLSWESRTTGIKSPSGLAWKIGGVQATLAASADWSQGELTFTAEGPFSLLELFYQRPVGEARAEGNVELQHIRLVAL